MIFIVFALLTLIETCIVFYKINEIQDAYETSKEIGKHLEFMDLDKLERFLLRIYMNYKGLLYVLIIIILFINLITSVIIYVFYELIVTYLIPLL